MAELHWEDLQEVVAVLEHEGQAEVALSPEVFMEVEAAEASELLEAYLTLAKAALLEEHAHASDDPVVPDDKQGGLRISLFSDPAYNFVMAVHWGRETKVGFTQRTGYAYALQVVEVLLQNSL